MPELHVIASGLVLAFIAALHQEALMCGLILTYATTIAPAWAAVAITSLFRGISAETLPYAAAAFAYVRSRNLLTPALVMSACVMMQLLLFNAFSSRNDHSNGQRNTVPYAHQVVLER